MGLVCDTKTLVFVWRCMPACTHALPYMYVIYTSMSYVHAECAAMAASPKALSNVPIRVSMCPYMCALRADMAASPKALSNVHPVRASLICVPIRVPMCPYMCALRADLPVSSPKGKGMYFQRAASAASASSFQRTSSLPQTSPQKVHACPICTPYRSLPHTSPQKVYVQKPH